VDFMIKFNISMFCWCKTLLSSLAGCLLKRKEGWENSFELTASTCEGEFFFNRNHASLLFHYSMWVLFGRSPTTFSSYECRRQLGYIWQMQPSQLSWSQLQRYVQNNASGHVQRLSS
jgi:hypothetical protein